MPEDARFWTMELDNGVAKDGFERLKPGDVTGLVDEKAGGIVAYVLDPARAEAIARRLNLLNLLEHFQPPVEYPQGEPAQKPTKV